MGIDKETTPSLLNVVIDDTKVFLDNLRKQADEDSQNDDPKIKKLSLTDSKMSFETQEYYYDESDNCIYYSGSIDGKDGSAWVSICLPISDIVLIDIIQASIKKLNKLKVAMEALK